MIFSPIEQPRLKKMMTHPPLQLPKSVRVELLAWQERARRDQAITNEFLRLLNFSGNIRELIRSIVAFLKLRSGCDAVGIRLREGEDYPYYETCGFPPGFIQHESSLCARGASNGCILRDSRGAAIMEGVCGAVLQRKCHYPDGNTTPWGSFWNNELPAFAARLPKGSASLFRGRCLKAGYRSMAWIPIGRNECPLGLIQLGSVQLHHFDIGWIFLWEYLADQLCISLKKLHASRTLKEMRDELEWRVRERTAKLEASNSALIEREAALSQANGILDVLLADRQRLEHELLKIAEREQRRIAQELHDGLCQHLAGTALMGSMLHRRLSAKGDKDAGQAELICKLLNTAVHEARNLSHGLHPVGPGAEDLRNALARLAGTVSNLFHIQCTFRGSSAAQLEDEVKATHLFRIAQEAVNNAIKHGAASCVALVLKGSREKITLSIRDNGSGIPQPPPKSGGKGLQIMNHRAAAIGASLQVRRAGKRGTIVSCTMPR